MNKLIFALLISFFITINTGYAASVLIASSNFNIEVNVPTFVVFTITSNAKFATITQGFSYADGQVTANIDFNDLVGVSQLALVVYTDGMVGQSVASTIPITFAVGTANYVGNSTGIILKSWNAPYTKAINEDVIVRIGANFSKMVNQQYRSIISFALVKY